MKSVVTRGNLSGLTGLLAVREMLCLLGVASGMTSKEIAKRDGCAPATVDKRLLSASIKLNTTKRAELVTKAFALGLISFASASSPSPENHHSENEHDGVLIA